MEKGMAISAVQERELYEALEIFAQSPVCAIFVVDSFGAFYSEQIRDLTIAFLKAVEGKGIEIGIKIEKEIEQELEKRVVERTAELVEVNAALKVLLKQREQDKTDTEETMAANLKLLVLPHLHKLKKSNLNAEHKAWVSLIDENLGKVSSPFIKNLNSKYSVLTPKELQVAEHIRSGKTSKEIADMMNLSPRTVDVFRHSLRKKLGLNNKKINLQSLLSSL